MTRLSLALLLSACVALAATGCGLTSRPLSLPIEPEAPPEPDTLPGFCTDTDPCRRNIDCPAGAVCDIEEGFDEGCCWQILCNDDSQCDDGELCDVNLGGCYPSDRCNPGDLDACADGERCVVDVDDYACVTLDQVPAAAACTLDRPRLVLRDGARVALRALARQADGALKPHAQLQFESAVGTVDDDVLTAHCEEAVPCRGTVVILNERNTPCGIADVVVHPAAPDDALRVVVLDADTETPVAADVQVHLSATRPTRHAATDDEGIALFGDVDASMVTSVSVVSDTHDWITYLHPNSDDIVVHVARATNDVVGIKGTFSFDDVQSHGDIELGYASLAPKASMSDFQFAHLFGSRHIYEISLDGVTQGPQPFPLPSTFVTRLAGSDIKADHFTVGQNPNATMAWSVGAQVRLADIGPVIASAATPRPGFDVVSMFLEFFLLSSYGFVDQLALEPIDRTALPDLFPTDGTPPWPADLPFTTVDVAPATPSQLRTDLALSSPPCRPGELRGTICEDHGNAYAMMTASVVPSVGLLPLGFGQSHFDRITTEPLRGVFFQHAPAHDGLEGIPSLTTAFVLDTERSGVVDPNMAAVAQWSTHVPQPPEAMAFAQSFLAHPSGRYVRDARTFRHTSAVDEDADMVRLRLRTAARTWSIYYAPDDAPSSTRPLLLEALLDDANVPDDPAIDIRTFAFGNGFNGPTPTDFDELIDFDGTSLPQDATFIGAWTTTSCARGVGEHCRIFETD